MTVDGLFATYESGLNLRLACTSIQVDAHGDAAFPVVLRPTPKRDEEESNAPSWPCPSMAMMIAWAVLYMSRDL